MKDLPRSLHLAVLRSQVKPFFQVVADYLKHRHRVASFICLVENLHALVEYLSLVLRKNLFGIEPRPYNQYVPKDKHSDSYPAQDSTRKRNYAVTIRFLSFL